MHDMNKREADEKKDNPRNTAVEESTPTMKKAAFELRSFWVKPADCEGEVLA